MKLIECKNKEQIIKALILKQQLNKEPVNELDTVAIHFLVEEENINIGIIRVHCKEETFTIDLVLLENSAKKLDAVAKLEEFAKNKCYDNVLIVCNLEDSYVYKQLDFQTQGDIFLEDEKVLIKMRKTI